MRLARPSLLLPALVGLCGLLFTLAGLLFVHFVLGPTLKAETQRELKAVAEQLAEKLDTGMFERWQDVNIAAQRQVLRERLGDRLSGR